MSQSSVRGSVSSAADFFHLMFPDSDIAAWFKTQNDDLVTYGLCPYLRLMTSLTEVPVTRGKWNGCRYSNIVVHTLRSFSLHWLLQRKKNWDFIKISPENLFREIWRHPVVSGGYLTPISVSFSCATQLC